LIGGAVRAVADAAALGGYPAKPTKENAMLSKTLVAAALVAAFAVPAVAATYTTPATKTTSTKAKTTSAASFYVEQSAKTHRCYVVAHKPNGKTMMEIGTTSYPTRTKAMAAMKAATACKKA
jgi:hypothetical protein